MSADGASTRIVPLDLPTTRRCFSSDEFVHLMQSHFFYFHVSNVWFNVALLARTRRVPARGEMARRPACGLCCCVRTWRRLHARRPVVCPHVANVLWRGRVAQQRSAGGLALLAELTRRPGWERRRAALVAAAVWPDYRLRAVRALVEDPGYITLRLARRLVWLSIWTKLAPVFGTGFRRWVRAVRTQYRRRLWHTH